MNHKNDVYEAMSSREIHLPDPPPKGGVYAQVKFFADNLVYVSGCGPAIGSQIVQGKLGKEFTVEQGQLFARNCMLNVLAVLQAHISDLNKVANVVKITTFVAGSDTFYDQPQVANGGSSLLIEIFGQETGAPSRSAVGVNALPGNIPVEIEALFQLQE